MTKKPKRGGKHEGALRAVGSASATPAPSDAEPEDMAHPGVGPKTDPDMSVAAAVPIVGIGASAGGLAAFESFFSAMPADTQPGMAFVLVQHLAPDHKSILSDLVKRYTRMQVFEVEDGMAVRPNCAYIIPPNRDMAFVNGTLQLLEVVHPRGLRLPIDFFFRSLAQDQHERAIGIVLSGTGGDGTLGARAIKGEGGLVIAQSPESTEYDGMPRSVIATGLVDYVLPPAEMPAQLIDFATRAFGSLRSPEASEKSEDQVKKIFVLLRAQTGHDFSLYKQTTISRRIERRMAIHQVEGLADYVRYLQEAPAEVDALFGDFLIGVTSFFRDPEAFTAFENHAVPRLFADKPANSVIRVWVPGCSTGEEAYSIAILIHERMQALKQSFQVQFFATDIDRRAIEVARAGIYPASIAADVSAERLARFFVQDPPGSYRIHKNIRDLLVFSEQDVIKDPPFSKLDLISCRNLMIYMGGELQKKVIPLFHYALNPGGILFLGTSETVGEFANLFAVTDRKHKLYERRQDRIGALRPAIGGFLVPMMDGRAAARPPLKGRADTVTHWRELTERALLQQDTHTGALVNEQGDILYLHGRTGHYLEPAPGEPGMNICKMAREGLRRHLTTALQKAVTQQAPVLHRGLRVKTNGDFMMVNLTVKPAGVGRDSAAELRLFVVVVEEAPAPVLERREKATDVPAGDAGTRRATAVDARIEALKKELRDKEENLQTTNEELETSNEELKASNEEMQSVNEELQSTNEELETSKEELQSVNEELATVNAELQTKVADLSRANNDMNNLLAGTGVGTLFVDHHLRILRFTPAITQVISLIQTDVGRPVGQLVVNLVGYDGLVKDTQEVLDTLATKEVEVQTADGAWFLLRIRPYRTLENVIEGAVISFTEITEMKQAQTALRESADLRRLAVVVRDASDAIMVQELHGRITAWNPMAVRMYGWSEAEALTMNIRDLIGESGLDQELARLQRLGRGEVLEPYRARRIAKDGRGLDVWVTASVLVSDSGLPYAIATSEKRAEEARQ